MRRAAAALEFALSLPVLITLTSGIADWGVYLSRQIELVEIARDAARFGVASSTPTTSARAHALTALTWIGIPSSTATVTAVTSTDTTLAAQVLTVSVSAPYRAPVGLLPSPATLTTQITMLVEP